MILSVWKVSELERVCTYDMLIDTTVALLVSSAGCISYLDMHTPTDVYPDAAYRLSRLPIKSFSSH